MPEDTKSDAIDLVVTACEKFSSSSRAARMIKEEMDKKFGAPFHVLVEEGFGFEISYIQSRTCYMFLE
ncbi:hypothetical protein NQ317_013563 [Molorchus minor]|uniref:Dynein light chain n=1 Tax=Molorchus minor TaxID=1323400 RepID=A0ABQ9JKL8_9CUCU|nr:hypothetical protein NQ317_013563 [Molorchus minor]